LSDAPSPRPVHPVVNGTVRRHRRRAGAPEGSPVVDGKIPYAFDHSAHVRRAQLVSAFEEVASLVSSFAVAEADALVKRLAELEAGRRLSPVEPSELGWGVFRAFGFEYAEVRWTRWIASLLDGTCGKKVSRVTWQALCSAIALASSEDGRHSWLRAGTCALAGDAVMCELAVDDLGRADLVVDHADTITVIENKLDADWHDREDRTQADAYRTMAGRLAELRGRRGYELVLLRNNDRVEAGGWIAVDYSEFARELRAAVREAVPADAPIDRVMEHVPVLATIHAIERDLLGLVPVQVPPTLQPVARCHWLRARLAAYRGRGP
jgi:hypothetical protein